MVDGANGPVAVEVVVVKSVIVAVVVLWVGKSGC